MNDSRFATLPQPDRRWYAGIGGAAVILLLCLCLALNQCGTPGQQVTPTPAVSPSASATASVTASSTPTVTPSTTPWTQTPTPSRTFTPTGTRTSTLTPTPTGTPVPQPPALTLPGDMTVEATGPAGAPATFTAAAFDPVDGKLTVACQPESGYVFGFGQTAVTCSATNHFGLTATGSFKVTVQDTTPPALNLPKPITAEATSVAGAAVTYSVSANDLVDGMVPVYCDRAPGSTFPLGLVPVSCTASDARGNVGRGSLTIQVNHTVPPNMTVPGDISIEATSPSGATATFSITATDTVDRATVTCSRASGSTFSVGTTLVTCTAQDEHNNTNQGSFRVIVVHTLAPSIQGGDASSNVAYYGSGTCSPKTVTITAKVTDAYGVSSVQLSYRFVGTDGGGSSSSWLSAPMNAVSDGFVATVALASQAPPYMANGSGRLEYQIVARDRGGLTTGTPVKTVTVNPCPIILYDLVKEAGSAKWCSGGTSCVALPFPGTDADVQGCARWWQPNTTMEDGSRPALALVTHPQWKDNAYILGSYPGKVQFGQGDRLRLKIGFSAGASGGNARFSILIRYFSGHGCTDDAGCRDYLASIYDTYNGALVERFIDLSAYAGVQATFYLQVDANGAASQDWATWVIAQLERP